MPICGSTTISGRTASWHKPPVAFLNERLQGSALQTFIQNPLLDLNSLLLTLPNQVKF